MNKKYKINEIWNKKNKWNEEKNIIQCKSKLNFLFSKKTKYMYICTV